MVRFSLLSDRADFLNRLDSILHKFSVVFDWLVASLNGNLKLLHNFFEVTFSNSREASQVSSFPWAFLYALVHLIFLGFFFFLNILLHFAVQNRNCFESFLKYNKFHEIPKKNMFSEIFRNNFVRNNNNDQIKI